MIVRQAQVADLEQQHARQFESGMLQLLREEFPERCADAGDGQLLPAIRAAVSRCRERYGIDDENSAAKFVYLTFLLGEDFDVIPQHEWIRATLRQRRPAMERLEIVMSGVIHHLENETGMLRIVEDTDASAEAEEPAQEER